jgi:L-ascorbate metabolism protein UlaG (beta-lactamase superfamily)
MTGKRSRWPAEVPARSRIVPARSVPGLRITCIVHSSLLIQVAGVNLLVDPVWSKRASPFSFIGPKRHNPPAIQFSDLPPIHVVLVTHNHYDHMDVAALKRLWESHHPRFLLALGNDKILRAILGDVEAITGDWWDSFQLSEQIRATVVPSYHWSSRGVRDHRMALWGGFSLDTPRGSIYCAGDTAYGDGAIFQEIARRCSPRRSQLYLSVPTTPDGSCELNMRIPQSRYRSQRPVEPGTYSACTGARLR